MNAKKSLNIAVIGAGYAGLSAAWDLVRAGHTVSVFERMDRPGGLAAGYRDPAWDWSLEHYYHHLFTSDEDIKALAEEVGLGDKLITMRPVTAQQYQGKSYALDGVPQVLSFPGMPFIDRVRMGMAIAYLKLTRDWKKLEQVTAREWMLKWMGRPAYEAIFEPLMSGKFGPKHADVPMSWLWARLHKRTIKLMYFDGGFQAFSDGLAAAVSDKGAKIRYRCPIEEISQAPDGKLQLKLGSLADSPAEGADEASAEAANAKASETLLFDRIICTSGPHILAKMAPELPDDYLGKLRDLPFLGAVVAVLSLDRKLMDEVYWLSIDKRELPFLAVVEHTNFVSAEHYGGENLVYVGDYLPVDHRYFSMSEDEILAEWLPALKSINPEFDPAWVKRSFLRKSRYAQPVVPLGFSKHIPELETPIPGLYLASMSQVYPWDRGTNYAVEIGRRVAKSI